MAPPWVATPQFVFCSMYAMLQRVFAGAEVQSDRRMARIWKTTAMPAPMLYILIDGKFEPELAAYSHHQAQR